MTPSESYVVSVQPAHPRGIAAVSARLPLARVPSTFATYLNQVYDAARSGAIQLDGQNIFVYRDAQGEADVDFGVGVGASFSPIGNVRYAMLPAGIVATTTHWGDYGKLAQAHASVIEWCRTNGRALEGTRWEIYGHWSNDPAQVRTDVYHLLAAEA